MVLPSTIQTTLLRYQSEINEALHRALTQVTTTAVLSRVADLQTYYGQMQYHLGWVNADFSPIENNPGKLLRPTLLLLAYEVAGAWGLATSDAAYLRRALPAAAAVLRTSRRETPSLDSLSNIMLPSPLFAG